MVITGADSGPPEPCAGSAVADLYHATFRRLAKSGVRAVGYVHTSYGRRTLQEVLSDIVVWYAEYGECLSGIFVDEVVSQVRRPP